MQAPRALPPLARFPLHCIAAAVACACADFAVAADTVRSAPVVVTATRVEQSSLDVPAAIDSIESRDFREARLGAGIAESMQRVPGTYVQNRETYAQEQQITVRGFGARSQFGTRGVKLFVDGIPASTPDGQGGSGLFDYASARNIEVLRGPFSALYGNHSGGVVQVFTEDGPKDPTVSGGVTFGSYNTQRYGLKFGGQYGNVNAVASGSYLTTDGYRDRSASERYLFNSKFGIKLDERSSLTVTASYLDQPLDQDPLTLTAPQVAQDRRQATAASSQFKSGRSLDNKQVGLLYEIAPTSQDTMRVLVYGGERNNLGFLGIAGTAATSSGGVSSLGREYGGIGGRWTHKGWELVGRPVTVTVGADYDAALETRKGYVNNDGAIGALRRDELNRVHTWGAYGQAEWIPMDSVTTFAGLRYTRVKFQSADKYITTLNPNDSGEVAFSAVTPVVGASVRVTPLTSVYMNAGRSFETPTLIELAYRNTSAGSGLNFALQPSTSNHYELGVKSLLGERTRLNASVFQIYTNNEIVVDQGGTRVTYKNAGKTERRGVELSGQSDLGFNVGLFASYTYLKATFADAFGTVAAGSQVPGVPRSLLYVDLVWRDEVSGLFAGVEHRRASKVYANDINTEYASGYKLTDLRIGITRDLAPFTVQLFARINNAFDEKYIGAVAVNATGNAFFAPAAERNFLAGVSASMKF